MGAVTRVNDVVISRKTVQRKIGERGWIPVSAGRETGRTSDHVLTRTDPALQTQNKKN